MLTGAVDGDLPLYRQWAMHAVDHGVWVGIDADWVYPIGALLPVVLPAAFGAAAYQLVWFLLLTAANGVSLWVLTDGGRRRSAYPAAWWWLAILLILSPVALLRLEGFTGPMVIVALVLLGTRPRLASALLAAAAWIKVWPAAVLLAALIASGRRRIIAISAGLTSLGILAIAVAAGGLWHVTSFLTTQGSRHLQLESVLGTPWLWMAIAHVPGAEVYQDWALETREVSGPGDIWIMENGTGVMLAAVAVIAVLIGWAHRRRGGIRRGHPSVPDWCAGPRDSVHRVRQGRITAVHAVARTDRGGRHRAARSGVAGAGRSSSRPSPSPRPWCSRCSTSCSSTWIRERRLCSACATCCSSCCSAGPCASSGASAATVVAAAADAAVGFARAGRSSARERRPARSA